MKKSTGPFADQVVKVKFKDQFEIEVVRLDKGTPIERYVIMTTTDIGSVDADQRTTELTMGKRDFDDYVRQLNALV